MRPRTSALTAAVVVLAALSRASAHEERLVIGQVDTIDPGRKVLVVQDPERDRTVRVIVDADTEVRRCRAGLGARDVKPGARVRVKYLDRGSGALESLSVLVLRERRS